MPHPETLHPRFAIIGAALSAMLALGPSMAPSQGLGLRVEAATTAGTAWVEDGNGTTVRQGLGGMAGIEIVHRPDGRRAILPALAPSLSVRAGFASLRATQEGNSWDAGRVRQLDLVLGAEAGIRRLAIVRVALVYSRVDGPNDVTPFRRQLGRLDGWGFDAAVSRPLGSRLPLRATVGVHALRLSRRSAPDLAVDGGWVGRFRVGIQYAP
jgi:hypothetical protein